MATSSIRSPDATSNITSSSAVPIAGTDYETVIVIYSPPVGTADKQFFSIRATQQSRELFNVS